MKYSLSIKGSETLKALINFLNSTNSVKFLVYEETYLFKSSFINLEGKNFRQEIFRLLT